MYCSGFVRAVYHEIWRLISSYGMIPFSFRRLMSSLHVLGIVSWSRWSAEVPLSCLGVPLKQVNRVFLLSIFFFVRLRRKPVEGTHQLFLPSQPYRYFTLASPSRPNSQKSMYAV